MAINIWPAISYAIEKIPFERMFVRRPDRKEELKELHDILMPHASPKPERITKITVDEPEEPPADVPLLPVARRRVHLEPNQATTSNVSTEETVAYQNREIGKVLLQLERHAAQAFRIAGKICDCGQSRHLLDLESLAEETISMVENPEIYQRILDYVKDLGPKATVEAVTSGQHDSEYPGFVVRARDLRKELLGTLDPHAMFPKKVTVEVTE